jgi:peptidylprolyl isomerase
VRRATLIAVTCALGLAGCGGDAKDRSTASTGAASGPATTAVPAPPGGAAQLQSKPKVTVPSGKPPTRLVIRDIVTGTGATAQPGDTVSVHYVGVSYANRRQFDASWDRQQPFTFQLGGGMVVPGWDQGIVGMKVNGRRELIIPPDLGYGAQGQPPAIAPNDTLVFVIDLLRVQPGAGGSSVPAQ